MERYPTEFLEHAVKARSQYDETCRTMAAEILELRAERQADRTELVALLGEAAVLLQDARRGRPWVARFLAWLDRKNLILAGRDTGYRSGAEYVHTLPSQKETSPSR